MGFKITTPPPIEREGRKAEVLDEKVAKALADMITKSDEDGNYPWALDDTEFTSRPSAQGRVLFYRRELHRQGFVEHPKQVRSRVVDGEKVGGKKGTFRFLLSYRDLSAINEASGNASGDDGTE